MAQIHICFSIVIMVMSCSSTGQQINTAEVGSTRYFISDFSPYSPRLNWFLAFQYCNTIGMELLTLPKQEEAQELLSFLEHSGKGQTDYWTSGNQLGSSMWTWMSSGQQLNSSFSYWDAQGPPLTKGSQSCMNLQDARWSASNCMEEKNFICQLTRCYYFNYAVTARQGNTTDDSLTITTKTATSKSKTPPSTNPNLQGQSSQSSPPTSIVKNIQQFSQTKSANTGFHQEEGVKFHSVRPLSFSPSNRQENKFLDLNNEIGGVLQELTPPLVTSGTEPQPQRDIAHPTINTDGIVQKLQRKESFSWAFTDDSHNNPK